MPLSQILACGVARRPLRFVRSALVAALLRWDTVKIAGEGHPTRGLRVVTVESGVLGFGGRLSGARGLDLVLCASATCAARGCQMTPPGR